MFAPNQQTAPPAAPANLMQQLFVLRGADMTLTTDQAFLKLFDGTNYVITNVNAVRKTGAFGTACAGGIYTGASKAGDALVAAAQSWAGLTGASKGVAATVATVAATNVQSATPNLSLTTGNTGALTADIFIYGFCID
jgi:hypothetical protein